MFVHNPKVFPRDTHQKKNTHSFSSTYQSVAPHVFILLILFPWVPVDDMVSEIAIRSPVVLGISLFPNGLLTHKLVRFREQYHILFLFFLFWWPPTLLASNEHTALLRVFIHQIPHWIECCERNSSGLLATTSPIPGGHQEQLNATVFNQVFFPPHWKLGTVETDISSSRNIVQLILTWSRTRTKRRPNRPEWLMVVNWEWFQSPDSFSLGMLRIMDHHSGGLPIGRSANFGQAESRVELIRTCGWTARAVQHVVCRMMFTVSTGGFWWVRGWSRRISGACATTSEW